MTEPLSTRVVAPPTATRPVVPGTTWRPALVSDIDAITAMMQLADAVDHPDFLMTRSEIAEDLESTFIDTELDTLVGVADDGLIMAYGVVVNSPGQETAVRSTVLGAVRPDWRGRGAGRQLLEWQRQRALQQLAASDSALPGWIIGYINEQSPWTDRLFDRLGFSTARFYVQLQRPLDRPIPQIALPEGFAIANPDPGQSDAVRLARNDAFRDHWGSQPMSAEEWSSMLGRAEARPDLSFVVTTADGDIAGFVLSEVSEADWPGQGFSSAYIDLVGVTRRWRGRRIAPAMLAHALVAIREAGLERAVLDVDTESLTGALGLYTGVGFVRSTRTRVASLVF